MRKRHLKKIIASLTVTLLLLAAAVTSVYAASNFYITDYDIRMVIREDDTYEITETIDVTFTANSHGIYRTIPRRNTVTRDGQTTKYNARVSDFAVLSGQPYEESDENGKYMYRIGDPDRYAATDTQYKIRYTYDTGGDRFKGADEVYMNLIGTDWEAQHIDHVSFEIVFPKDVDATKIGVKTGNQENIAFEAVDSRTIRGETSADVLKGLTVRAVLPEGYFTRKINTDSLPGWITTGILALIAAAGALLWKRYGVDPYYPVTLEFYPPEDLSAPEVAYLSKESIGNMDVVSMLFELADKGYLMIRELGDDSYDIVQMREYDGDNKGAKIFLDGLFLNGNTVNTNDLENSFYETVSSVESAVESRFFGSLYDQKAKTISTCLKIAGLAGMAVHYIVTVLAGGVVMIQDPMAFIFPVVSMFIFGFMLSAIIHMRMNTRQFGNVLLAVIFVCWCAVWAITIIIGWVYGSLIIPFVTGALLSILILLISALCEKKTDYYASIRARIDGYKDFLMTAEKDKIESVADSDPNYYYHTLAFAYALGITSVFVSRFASIADRVRPDWYDPYGDYDPDHMHRSMNDMMDRTGSSMTSHPSDDSSDGGGSFDGGGGGGGGGGGSW